MLSCVLFGGYLIRVLPNDNFLFCEREGEGGREGERERGREEKRVRSGEERKREIDCLLLFL